MEFWRKSSRFATYDQKIPANFEGSVYFPDKIQLYPVRCFETLYDARYNLQSVRHLAFRLATRLPLSLHPLNRYIPIPVIQYSHPPVGLTKTAGIKVGAFRHPGNGASPGAFSVVSESQPLPPPTTHVSPAGSRFSRLVFMFSRATCQLVSTLARAVMHTLNN